MTKDKLIELIHEKEENLKRFMKLAAPISFKQQLVCHQAFNQYEWFLDKVRQLPDSLDA